MRRWGLAVILAASVVWPSPTASPVKSRQVTKCRASEELDRVRVTTPAQRPLGLVVLRHSEDCHATWARFEPGTYPGPILVTITARRPAGGTEETRAEATFAGQTVLGPMVATGGGCIEMTVQVRAAPGEGEATTRCVSEPDQAR